VAASFLRKGFAKELVIRII